MSEENRVLALHLAIESAVPSAAGETPLQRAAGITTAAGVYYRWLEGPAMLVLAVAPLTFDQAAPDGPGMPTVRKGTAVQLTDVQQVTLTVAEADSKGQPASDSLTWSVDNPAVVAVTPSADTMSCLCVAGTDGTATVTVTDGSVTPPLTATESFTVVSSAATSLVISAGTPEDQPPAAPPAA